MARYKLTKEDSSKGGQKSRRPSFDQQWESIIDVYMDKTKRVKAPKLLSKKKGKGGPAKLIDVTYRELMVQASIKAFQEGNSKPFQMLVERAYKKPIAQTENRDVTLEENPVYTQMKEMTEMYKDKK